MKVSREFFGIIFVTCLMQPFLPMCFSCVCLWESTYSTFETNEQNCQHPHILLAFYITPFFNYLHVYILFDVAWFDVFMFPLLHSLSSIYGCLPMMMCTNYFPSCSTSPEVVENGHWYPCFVVYCAEIVSSGSRRILIYPTFLLFLFSSLLLWWLVCFL